MAQRHSHLNPYICEVLFLVKGDEMNSNEKTIRYYNERGPQYYLKNKHAAHLEKEFSIVSEFAKKNFGNGLNIFDVGFNDGKYSFELAQYGCVIGIDSSPKALEFAEREREIKPKSC